MAVRHTLCLAVLIFTVGMFSEAQEQKTEIKRGPAPITSPASGHEMFMSYGASCHRKGASGDGPASVALKQAPADLQHWRRKMAATSRP